MLNFRTKRIASYAIATILALAVISAPARADGGTPLMWTLGLQLYVLNIAIGFFEAWALRRFYPGQKIVSNWWMIVANYFSMIVGAFTVPNMWVPLIHILPGASPLTKAGPALIIMVIVSWVMSVVLEWPFVALAIRKRQLEDKASADKPLARTFKASIVAQAASYALLIPLYLLVSPINLVTGGHVQSDLKFVKPVNAVVYYIEPETKSVWSMNVDGSNRTFVKQLSGVDANTRLFVNETSPRKCDIYITTSNDYNNKGQILIKDINCSTMPPDEYETDKKPLYRTDDDGSTFFGGGVDLQNPNNRYWRLFVNFWATGALSIWRNTPGELRDNKPIATLSFDTPFEEWYCRNATILPTGQVVFEIDESTLKKKQTELVALDLPTQKVGFITFGQGPAVILKP